MQETKTIGSIGWQIIFGAAELVAASCSHCEDAPSLAVFMKDCVNVKIGKPIHDKKNFKHWMGVLENAKFHENEQDLLEREIRVADNILAMTLTSVPREIVVTVDHNEDTVS